jgi:hypothetical protein
VGKLYGHFKGSEDTVKPHGVEVLHKNVAYYRTRAPLFSLSGCARERVCCDSPADPALGAVPA